MFHGVFCLLIFSQVCVLVDECICVCDSDAATAQLLASTDMREQTCHEQAFSCPQVMLFDELFKGVHNKVK